ncbi:MAG: DEAD/DEAH box helicase, partial [Clostridia bacterium]|nr:DEAD/DEAH box helicase [Clostridia bacterium]
MYFNLKSLPVFMGRIDLLATDLQHWKKNGFRVILLTGKNSRCQKLIEDLQKENLEVHQNIAMFKPEQISQLPGSIFCEPFSLSNGFEFTAAKLVLITEKELYGQIPHTYRKKTSSPDKMNIFADLKEGDFVVHLNHGIGLYLGLRTEERDSIHREYLVLKYAGDDKLYIPTDQAGMLQKYLGSEASAPKLSKLGSTEWVKSRNKVKAAVKEMAEELLKLYAVRETLKGHTFGVDTVWQKEFEDSFIFEETPDQLKALEEIKADMEKNRPMDRLLCGDVGYGKTEVALRAAFKAVNDGKQAAVLVPTTLLAQQHFFTFSERLQNYPVRLEMLSRFKTPKERREIIQALATGQIDIVIGTHRLLQEDIRFKTVGLLVVDEEQRFGVEQKERIKELKSNIDVLSLSATPIPRTL